MVYGIPVCSHLRWQGAFNLLFLELLYLCCGQSDTSSHAAPVVRAGVFSCFGFGPLFFGYAVILKSHLVKVCEKIQ